MTVTMTMTMQEKQDTNSVLKLNANRDNPGTWQIFTVVQGE